jgi:hypothetical protein
MDAARFRPVEARVRAGMARHPGEPATIVPESELEPSDPFLLAFLGRCQRRRLEDLDRGMRRFPGRRSSS